MSETPSVSANVEQPRSIARSAGWAAFWIVFDGLIVGQIAVSFLCVCYVLFYALPRALIAIKTPPRRNYYLMRAGVFIAVPVITASLVAINAHVANKNASVVVSAVERYYAEQKRFPKSLNELVPKYLPELPNASYALMAPGFLYRVQGGHPTLMITVLPPFGRRIYDFDKKSWRDLD